MTESTRINFHCVRANGSLAIMKDSLLVYLFKKMNIIQPQYKDAIQSVIDDVESTLGKTPLDGESIN